MHIPTIKIQSTIKTSGTRRQIALQAALIATALLVAGSARAQEATATATGETSAEATGLQRVRAGLFIGGNYLSSENELGNSPFDNQVPRSGFLFGGRLSYMVYDTHMASPISPQFHLELESKLTLSSTKGGDGRASQSSPVLGWRANAVVDLFPSHDLVPFGLLGMGGETVIGDNTFMTSPDTDFAWQLGGGVRYPLADRIDLRADLRFGLTAGRYDYLASLAEVHIGATYRFGVSSEPVVVVVEKEPEPAPPEPLDSDKDGILDADDACPQMPELINGIDDTDGCPEVDSDNDGLLGSADKCPAAAEDKDGFEDADGCPDLDNDGDGVEDIADQCPDEAENANNYQDDDGCPDEIPIEVQEFTGTIEGIRFKSGSARILHSSRRTLDAAVAVLRENPSVRIEISGHTDNRGKDEDNRTLARKRADYVKWYLVDKGIDADRIETVGYGPDKPIADNKTRKGRAQNRRIEFKLISTVKKPAVLAPGASPVKPNPLTPNATKPVKPAPEATPAPSP